MLSAFLQALLYWLELLRSLSLVPQFFIAPCPEKQGAPDLVYGRRSPYGWTDEHSAGRRPAG